MVDSFQKFENLVRRAYQFSDSEPENLQAQHPFEHRNIHQCLPDSVRNLFDDGHYAQATFEAFKFVDKEIQRLSNSSESGFKLMMQVLSEASPNIKLTPCITASEKDEQKGFQFLFAGGILAIRNPRGHEYSIKDNPDLCLDYLSLASMLIRRIESSGYSVVKT
jgi:uncharacterized protein (TIGR02391 family)